MLLTPFEVRKLLTGKLFIGITVIVVLLNAVLCYFTTITYNISDDIEIQKVNLEIFDLFRQNPNMVIKEYDEYTAALNEYEYLISKAVREGLYDFNPVAPENNYINLPYYNDKNLYADLFGAVDYIKNSPKTYEKTSGDSYRILSDIVDSGNKDSYSYQYQTELILHYEKLIDISYNVTYIRGWDKLFSYNLSDILVFACITAIIPFIFITDSRNKITSILCTMKYGQRRTICAKLLTAFLFTVFLTFLTAFSSFITIYFKYGFSSPFEPVQIIQAFKYCPYPISVLQYFFISIGIKLLSFNAFSAGIVFVSYVFSNELYIYGAAGLFIAAQALFTAIPQSSSWQLFRQFSLFQIVKVNPVFIRYTGINFFGYCMSYTAAVILLTVIIYILIIISMIALNKKQNTEFIHTNLITLPSLSMSKTTFSGGSISLLRHEAYKILQNRSLIIMFCAFCLLKGIVSYQYFLPDQSVELQIYENYLLKLSGEVTGEKLSYLDSEKYKIDNAIAQYTDMREQYIEGKITLDELNDYVKDYNYAVANKDAFATIKEYSEYLTAADFDTAYFINNTGINKLLSQPFDIVLMTGFAFLFSGSFAGEYQCGFTHILRITKYGRNKLWKDKLFTYFLFASLLLVLFKTFDLVLLINNYTFSFLDKPIRNLMEYSSIQADISIIEYICWTEFLRLLTAYIYAAIIISLSAISKNVIISVLTSSAVFILLYIFPLPLWFVFIYLLIGIVMLRLAYKNWNGERYLL